MVWKKAEEPALPPPVQPLRPAAPQASPPSQPPARRERASIGPSVYVHGELTGDEDLLIEGRIEGKVELLKHSLTVGKSGRVKADLYARVITVEGEVEGNLYASEQAVMRPSALLRGNISSPRVVLEDGSRFKGTVDMESREPEGVEAREPAPEAAAESGSWSSPAGESAPIDPAA
ncbi:MAG TPA: polymer-forming cytoskeletal protein [Thermoanaerobaculia bacterium]|nr:polymer-forming cytoskeletal protein [Thermoanaerobaculia bacterium]